MSRTTTLPRRVEPELMDDPQLDATLHVGGLRGLSRINFYSNSAAIPYQALRDFARASNKRSFSLLDVATGAADTPVRLVQRLKRTGIDVALSGCDISPRAVSLATDNAQRAGVSAQFFPLDILRTPLPAQYDVVMSSLFMHHLSDDESVTLLQHMAAAARELVLINDMRRCRSGLAAAHVFGRLLTRSPIVHVDAVRSAWAAYTVAEVQSLAERAGLRGATVVPRWPWRFLLLWRRR